MFLLKLLGIYVLAYCIGSIPFSQIIASLAQPGTNLRKVGSANSGATNVFITVGPVPGIIALLLDMSKGLVALFIVKSIMQWNFNTDLWWLLSVTLFVVLGHDYSLFLGFKGGKGLAILESYLIFFGPVWAIMVHLPQGIVLFQKNMQRGIAVANIMVLLMFPVMGCFWFIENYMKVNWLTWNFTHMLGEPIQQTLPLTVFSFIWMLMFFIQRVLDNPGVKDDINKGISAWRAIMLRGLFEVFPRESDYRHPDEIMPMGEDVLIRKKR